MNIINDVKEFIYRRFPVDNNWCTGNCYWFATILCHRFQTDLIMWYFPIENHWMAGLKDGSLFFDWQEVRLKENLKEEPVLWDNMKEYDQLLYSRLVRNCVI